MLFKLVEDLFKNSRVFGDKDSAKQYARINVDGYYQIDQDDEDPEAYKLQWDNDKDPNRISDEEEPTPLSVWGDRKSRGQKFVERYRNQLKGLRVYYLAFKNGRPLTDSNNNITYYIDKQYAIDKLNYYDMKLDVLSYIIE